MNQNKKDIVTPASDFTIDNCTPSTVEESQGTGANQELDCHQLMSGQQEANWYNVDNVFNSDEDESDNRVDTH